MSALLTTTMPYMKVVIDTLKEKGIRDDYIVLVGGAPLNEDVRARPSAPTRTAAMRRLPSRRPSRSSPSRRAMRRSPTDADDARWATVPRTGDRLRSAGPRNRCAAAKRTAGRHLDVQCLPRGAAQPPGAHSGGRSRRDPREPRPVRRDLRRLRRLRHRRRARRRAPRRRRRAHARRPLLRILRRRRAFRGDGRRRARHVLPDRFSASGTSTGS